MRVRYQRQARVNTVSVHPRGEAEFARFQHRDPPNTETVRGVGDEAFTIGLAALYVRFGNSYFVLVTQHGAGRAGIRDLRKLALVALERLGSR